MSRDGRSPGPLPNFAARKNGFHPELESPAASSPVARLPAALGISSPSDESLRRKINDRPKFFPQPGSTPLAPSKSSDGLRFSSEASELPRTFSAAQGASIPTWSPQGSTSRRTPIPGLPLGSQQLDPSSPASPSRNFLVPIGATGARQKLSIANATSRRRLAASESVELPTVPPSAMKRSQSQTEFPAGPFSNTSSAMNRSTSHNALRSSAEQRDRLSEFERMRDPASTSTEHVQQAAMQRLSSQRILPQARTESGAMSRDTSSSSQRSFSKATSVSSTPPRAGSQEAPPAAASPADRVKTSVTESVQSMTPDRASPARPDRAAARALAKKVTEPVPSLAETYKQSMLDRDTRADRPDSAVRVRTAESAPKLEMQLPSSSFFEEDASRTLPGTVNPTSSQLRPNISEKEEAKRESTLSTSESDRSIGSFEGAYDFNGTVPYVSLQSSYDEALKIQNRLHKDDVEPGLAYDDLFKGGKAETVVTPQSKLQDSYLAMSDEDDGATVSHGEHGTPRLGSRVARPANAASPSSRPTAGVWDVGTAFVGDDQDPAGPKMVVDDVTFQPVTPPIVPQSNPTTTETPVPKPSLPHNPSFQTLRVSPLQPEPKPSPKEEAALEAGALAAHPGLSPRSTTFAEASSTAPPSFAGISPFTANFTAREAARSSFAVSPHYRSTFDGQDEMSSWQRRQEASTPVSPLPQSRFSEASTIRSDSLAPTRNDDLQSVVDSATSSDDGMDAESGQTLPTSAWNEVEGALHKFRERSLNSPTERGNVLRGVLLPFLALEAETASVETVGHGAYTNGKHRRALFFDWIRFLLLELQHVQTSADRGAILESIACIIESRNFSVSILSADAEDDARFSSVFGHILAYAIGELNKKGVYQNTLIFSGRLLAVAFFRVRGVASKLLRALPVSRFALERVSTEFGWKDKVPSNFVKFANHFPPSLRSLCYKDARSYLRVLDNEAGQFVSYEAIEEDRYLVRQPEVEVEMSGNWLRRWQSDDSELFFSFCRSYHRQLAGLLASSKQLKSLSKLFFGGPGYAHLATCVHQKCLALVHRVILSVTTLSSQKNFNPAGETANVFSGSTAGKPRILEAANRRCTAIVVDIVRAPAGSNMIFAPMLGLHIKVLIQRTSLYDVQGVFCLLDWLDGVLSHMDSADLLNQGLVDVGFIISTIGRLLENADHALALMRTIAFCYANFGVLTSTTSNRIAFCEHILLRPAVFNKLFLSWSFTIRAYYLHLLVFRLARIRDFPRPQDDPSGMTAVRVVRLFNQRLEDLRKRHNQLSPDTDSSSDGGLSEDAKSRKSGTSTFVSTIKRASSESAGPDVVQEAKAKAEKLALTSKQPIKAASTPATTAVAVDGKNNSASKTKTWLKSFRSGGRNAPRPDIVGEPARKGEPRTTEAADELRGVNSNKTTPRTSFESNSDAMSDVSTLAGSIRTPKGDRNGVYEFDFKQQQNNQSKQQTSPRQPQQPQPRTNAAQPDTAATVDGSPRPAKGRPAALVIGPEAGADMDTVFDLQSTHVQLPTPGHVPGSPRISRAFSRRASILPSAASDLVANAPDELPAVPGIPLQHLDFSLQEGASVYDDSLHVYAVSSLREYEQTVQEHDDFFAALPKDQTAQVPRLPVTWPAMWSSTGE